MSIFLIDRTEVKTHQVINILLPLILFLASISLGKESYRNFFNIVSFFYSFVILSILKGNQLSVYIHSDTDTSRMLIMSPNSSILLLLCVLELSPCGFSYVKFYLFCFICFDLLYGLLKTITFIQLSCIFISYQCESSLFLLVFSVMRSNLSDVKYYYPCFLPFPSSHSFCSFPSSSLYISILLSFSSSVYSTLVSFYLDLL